MAPFKSLLLLKGEVYEKEVCILFAVLWMGFIFYMSHQPAKISSVQSDNWCML